MAFPAPRNRNTRMEMTTVARILAKRYHSVSRCCCGLDASCLKTVFWCWVDWRRSVPGVAGVLVFLALS